MSRWYATGGADNDVVLFSKVRVARNLSDTPFRSKLSKEVKRYTLQLKIHRWQANLSL